VVGLITGPEPVIAPPGYQGRERSVSAVREVVRTMKKHDQLALGRHARIEVRVLLAGGHLRLRICLFGRELQLIQHRVRSIDGGAASVAPAGGVAADWARASPSAGR